MKKTIALLLAICMVLLLTACGGSKDVDLEELGGKLVASAAFTMDMSQYQMDAALAAPTYGFDAADAVSCSFWFNNATAEEIFLMKAASKDAAANIETLCQSRVENQKLALQMYAPDAIPRLDSAIIRTQGEYVVFVVANDSAAAKAIVDQYIK